MKNKAFFTVSGLIMLAFLLASCGREDKASTARLSILSPHSTDVRDNLIPMFKAWHRQKYNTEIEVEWLNQGGSTDDLRFIRSEYARNPGGIGIDLFWGGGISPYLTLKKEGSLQRTELAPELLQRIPARLAGVPLYDPDRTWYGSCLTSFGIMTNRAVARLQNFPEIRTWEDLTSPRLRGWVGTADPRHSGVSHVSFDIILQGFGWQDGWRMLTLLSANMKRFNMSSKDVIKDVTSGDVVYAMTIDYFAWKEIEQLGPEQVGFIVPEGITMVNPDCFGVLKGAPHPVEARRFMEFILSDPAQLAWMAQKGTPGAPVGTTLSRLSMVPAIYDQVRGRTLITVNPFQTKGDRNYDVELGEKLWDVTSDLMGCLLVDSHEALVQAWQAISARGAKPEALARLCAVPVTQEQALQLADVWKDPLVRNDKINQWLRFAQEKYAAAAKLSR